MTSLLIHHLVCILMHQTQRAGSNSNREGISRPSQGPKDQIQKSSTEYNPDC